MFKRSTLYVSIVFLISACTTAKKEAFDLLILNASIVDVKTGNILPEKLIGISKDTIRLIDDMSNSDMFEANQSLDAKGKYIMPGLWDTHVHFRGGDTLINENKDLLPLYLAYGITTIRDAGGDISSSVLDWRRQIQKGTLDGPTIFTSGPKLDGAKPAWPGSIKVVNVSDVEGALDSLESMNVDYVKMYDGSLTKEVYYEIIKQAEKRGLKTTGHMPLSANILEAIDYGLDGSEHIYYSLKSCSPLADSLTKLNIGYGMIDQIIATYDEELANQVFSKMGANNVFITPTLHIGKTLAEVADADHSQDSLLAYIGKGIQQTYEGRVESAKQAKARGSDTRKRTEQKTRDMMVPMYEAGVNIIAGSDCGAFNSFVYPGQSLHKELISLVSSGLTPQQALTTSVINGPKFFDLENSYGSVDNGKIADLILLEKNPLENIESTREISSVITKGKVYNRQAIDNMMRALKNQ